MSDQYGVRDAACPISTKGGGALDRSCADSFSIVACPAPRAPLSAPPPRRPVGLRPPVRSTRGALFL